MPYSKVVVLKGGSFFLISIRDEQHNELVKYKATFYGRIPENVVTYD